MANLKNAADNGALITLGLVGVVAAAGAFVKRGSGNMHDVMESLIDHLNDEGFNFEMMDDYLIVDEVGKISITAESPMDESHDPALVEVAKRIEDRMGNLVDMKVLGEFAPHDFDGITRVVRKNARKPRAPRRTAPSRMSLGGMEARFAEGQPGRPPRIVFGSGSMSQIKSSGLRDLSSLDKGEFFKLKPTAKKVYRKGDYVRSERKYEGLDTDDISRTILLRGSTRVFVDFEY